MTGRISLYQSCRYIGAATFIAGVCGVNQASSEGFNLTLSGGLLYGPGPLGEHRLQAGEITNFVVTAPLTGYVPMYNNGAALPNLSAEALHVTEVDGRLSNGVIINENIDAGFVLDIPEPDSGEMMKLFVCSTSREQVTQDTSGNLQFSLTAGFDPGLPDYVVEMDVVFVTGAAWVPKSEKTRRNLEGGHDNADAFPSGYARVGRLGDFDHNGMLDGEFVLGDNAPFDLVVAEGDPILIVRPFVSDIPVSATDAAVYQLRGIVENYPAVLASAIAAGQAQWLIDYLDDIELRVDSTRETVGRIRMTRSTLSVSSAGSFNRDRFIDQLNLTAGHMGRVKHALNEKDAARASEFLKKFFTGIGDLVVELENT